MATIGSLIIEIAGDNSRLRRALKESSNLTDKYKQDINTARREFGSSAVRLREDLFSGVLSPAAFAKQGTLAAKEYNAALLKQIGELRNAGQLTPRLHAALVSQLQDAGLESGKSYLAGLSKSLTSIGDVMKGIGTKLTIGATLPIAAEGVASFKAASDAAEEANAFRVTFGPMADEVQKKLDALHRTIPVTNTDLQKLAGGFGALLLPMGIAPQKAAAMSTRLVELAGDIQSLRNIPFNEVVQRLTSGLVGETEAVRRLGANIGETALKAEALRLGFGGNVAALTGAQKAQAIYNILLRDTALATGDAANTMNSAANQVRFVGRNFQEMQIIIGNQLLPIVTPLIARFSDFLERLKKVNPETILFGIKVAGIVAVTGPALVALGSLTTVLGGLAGVMGKAATAISAAGGIVPAIKLLGLALTGPVGIVVGIAAIVAGLVGWAIHLDNVKNKMDDVRGVAKAMTREQLAAEIQRRSAAIGVLQQQQMNAPLVLADATNVAAGAHAPFSDARPTKTRGQIADEITAANRELSVYTDQWRTLTTEENNNAATAARQLAIWKQSVAEAQKMAAAISGKTNVKDFTNTVGTLAELKKTAVEFHDTAQAMELDKLLGAQLAGVDAALVKTGGKFDETTLKLVRLRKELLDNSITAQILSGQYVDEGMRRLPGVGTTPRDIGVPQTGIRAGAALSYGLPPSFRLQNGATVNTNLVPTPSTPGGPTVNEARFRVALTVAQEGLEGFGRGLLDAAKSGGLAALKSIAAQLNPFAQVITAISAAATPLAPVMTALGNVVAKDLKPVFDAFVPVIQKLIPVVDAVLRVVAPIVSALAPMLEAFIPILRALFPIFKAGAIVATYLFQAFALGASIVLRAVGNIVIGFGTIVKALAVAVDKLPFVSAKGAINAAQGVIDFGKSLLNASDEFKQSASDMAKARETIKSTSFDDTTASIDKLGEAAAETSDALRNGVNWWKSAFAVWQATHARDDMPTTPTPPPAGVPTGAGSGPPAVPSMGGGGSQGAQQGAHGSQPSMSITIENVTLAQASDNPRELLRGIVREAQRISQATYGTTARWQEVL